MTCLADDVAQSRTRLSAPEAKYDSELRTRRSRVAAARAAVRCAESELRWLSAHLTTRSSSGSGGAIGAAWLAASHAPLPRLAWVALARAAGEPHLDFRRAQLPVHLHILVLCTQVFVATFLGLSACDWLRSLQTP
jgi:hypothetical protein